MSEWRDHQIMAPFWVPFMQGLLGAVAGLTFFRPGAVSSRSLPQMIFISVFLGVFIAMCYALFRQGERAAMRRAAAGIRLENRVAMVLALRTGKAPTDPSLDQSLLGLIVRLRRHLRWAHWMNRWLFGTGAILSLSLALLEQKEVWLVYAALQLCVLISVRVALVRMAARPAQLESTIHQRVHQ
jgi:cbb3-type cytochrome oxidase subunit 3